MKRLFVAIRNDPVGLIFYLGCLIFALAPLWLALIYRATH